MQVQLVLNPEAPEYEQLVRDLREELAALKGLRYEEEEAPAPANVLSVEHDVVNFVFQHSGQILTLATALLQLARAISERRGITQRKEAPPAVLVIGENSLSIPASPQAEKRFLGRIKQGKTGKPTSKKTRSAAGDRAKKRAKDTRKRR